MGRFWHFLDLFIAQTKQQITHIAAKPVLGAVGDDFDPPMPLDPLFLGFGGPGGRKKGKLSEVYGNFARDFEWGKGPFFHFPGGPPGVGKKGGAKMGKNVIGPGHFHRNSPAFGKKLSMGRVFCHFSTKWGLFDPKNPLFGGGPNGIQRGSETRKMGSF